MSPWPRSASAPWCSKLPFESLFEAPRNAIRPAKFGFAVTGTIDPSRVLTNAGAKPGDVLLLTKRLGTGVIATALKKGQASEESLAAAIESMRTLNRRSCEIVTRFSEENGNAVHAATDITGFGLIGHAREMALASNATIEFDHARVQALPGALEAIRQGFIPGGLNNNREFASCAVAVAPGVPAAVETLLYDPQTSGGLLIAVAEKVAAKLEAALRAADVPVTMVGRVLKRGEHPIVVV